jgi:glycosyltransferase involved in cell wall biosynthesis
VIAILPALGLGVAGLVRSGQYERLRQYEWRAYANAFDGATYFSYETERVPAADDDGMVIVPRPRAIPVRPYGAALPFVHRALLSKASLLLVTNVTGALAGVIAKRLTGAPLVVQVSYHHDAVARVQGHSTKALLLRALRFLALRAADGVLVPSAALEREVQAAGYKGYRLVVPNGVDLARFHPVVPAWTPPPVVLFVGRAAPEKNLATLRSAVGMVKGGAILREVSGEPYARMPVIFQAAKVFCLPSFTEGCSKALLEAMASGLPCVVSAAAAEAVPEAPLIVVDDPTDPHALAAGIRKALKTPELGMAARAYVERAHDIHRLLDQEVRFLQWVGRGRS